MKILRPAKTSELDSPYASAVFAQELRRDLETIRELNPYIITVIDLATTRRLAKKYEVDIKPIGTSDDELTDAAEDGTFADNTGLIEREIMRRLQAVAIGEIEVGRKESPYKKPKYPEQKDADLPKSVLVRQEKK